MNEIKDYIRNLKETKPQLIFAVKNFDHNYIRNLKETKPTFDYISLCIKYYMKVDYYFPCLLYYFGINDLIAFAHHYPLIHF